MEEIRTDTLEWICRLLWLCGWHGRVAGSVLGARGAGLDDEDWQAGLWQFVSIVARLAGVL